MNFSRLFLYPFDITFKRLKEATSFFGYNPRPSFTAALSKIALESETEKVKSQITYVSGDESNMVQLLKSARTGDSEVSHSIYQISPQDDENRFLTQCSFDAVSRWALNVSLEEYEKRKAGAAIRFYHEISGMAEAGQLRGHIFERQVLKYLDRIGAEITFPIRGLAASEEEKWTYPGRVKRYTFLEDSDFIEQMKTAVQNQTPLHLVPTARNFAAVDSILYDPNEGITCIQITINEDHAITVSGLQRIQGWLGRDRRDLHGLRPAPEKPWRFIFIVPEEMEAGFGLQLLGGDETGIWARKVHQSVLGLDVLVRKPVPK